MDFSSFIDLLENKRSGIIKEVEGVLDKLSSRTIEYSYVDRFLQSTLDNLPAGMTQEYELTSAGYSLFWLAKRGYFITEEKCPFVYDTSVNSKWLEDYLNFLVGVQEQQWNSVYTPLYNFLKSQLINKYSLVLYEDSSDELFATAIIDILDEDEHQQLSNTYIMSIVEAMRRLCSYKKKYNIEIVGYNIIEGVVMPSLEKHILADKLPWV